MISKENALIHEWIGLEIRILKSSCKVMEGIRGKVVDETKNTLIVENKEGKTKRIPKRTCVFELQIDGGYWVKIDGSSVCYSPEDRLKKIFKKLS